MEQERISLRMMAWKSFLMKNESEMPFVMDSHT